MIAANASANSVKTAASTNASIFGVHTVTTQHLHRVTVNEMRTGRTLRSITCLIFWPSVDDPEEKLAYARFIRKLSDLLVPKHLSTLCVPVTGRQYRRYLQSTTSRLPVMNSFCPSVTVHIRRSCFQLFRFGLPQYITDSIITSPNNPSSVPYTGWPKKVSHYREPSLNRINNRQPG